MEDQFGWMLVAGVSLWWLHNREVPDPINVEVESPDNTSEVDPKRWPSAEQPQEAIVPNADPIPDPVVQDLYDKMF